MAALAVLGAGAWGTAIAAALASRHRVTLWARDAAQARADRRLAPQRALPAGNRIARKPRGDARGACRLVRRGSGAARDAGGGAARVAGAGCGHTLRLAVQGIRAAKRRAAARDRRRLGHPRAERRAFRPVVRARGRARIALRADPGGRRRRIRGIHRGAAARRAHARLPLRRPGRRRNRRRGEERAGDRGGHLRWPRPGAERARGADHARPGRTRAPGRGARRPRRKP